jgi:hypothetical protein
VLDPVVHPDVEEVPRMSLREEQEQEEESWTVVNKRPRRSSRKTTPVDKYRPAAWGRLGGLGEVAGPHQGQVGSLEGTLGQGALFGPIRHGDDLSSRISGGRPLRREDDMGPQGSLSENPGLMCCARIEDQAVLAKSAESHVIVNLSLTGLAPLQ